MQAFVTDPVRRMLRLCKILIKILLTSGDMKKKKGIAQMILHLFRYWKTQSGRPLIGPQHAAHILSAVMFTGIMVSRAFNFFFLVVTNSSQSFLLSNKMIFTWKCAASLQGKDKGMPVVSPPGAKWELPTGFSVTISWLSLSWSQEVCAEQHRYAPTHVNYYADH